MSFHNVKRVAYHRRAWIGPEPVSPCGFSSIAVADLGDSASKFRCSIRGPLPAGGLGPDVPFEAEESRRFQVLVRRFPRLARHALCSLDLP